MPRRSITTEQALIEHRWTHVVEPFDIPSDWKIYRAYDWGYGRPWAMTYYGLNHDGVAYEILEIYGCTKTPNEGVKWTNKQQFDYIRQVEDTHPYLKGRKIYGVADPAIWDGSKDGNGISAADEADKHGIWMEKGNNSRIEGWMQVRERLKFDQNGFARLYFFNHCKDMIRTIPLMMFDDVKVEDLDSSLEDHLADTLRYFCMMNPVPPMEAKTGKAIVSDPLNQFTQTTRQQQLRIH